MSGDPLTLHFERQADLPPETLFAVWTAPAARAIWEAPDAAAPVGIDGQRDGRREIGWLHLAAGRRAVNSEVLSTGEKTRFVSLVTTEITPEGTGSRLAATVQLSPASAGTESEYREEFDRALDKLILIAERTMLLHRVIEAPRDVVWNAWMNPQNLPQWWGPDGFSCRTKRIDLRQGGEWVFDMIGPDGTVFPNHHRYGEVVPLKRIAYELLWGENGPKHADAWASFEEEGNATRVTLGMVFATAAEFQEARGFGAIELGLQTLGKLARFAGAGQGSSADP